MTNCKKFSPVKSSKSGQSFDFVSSLRTKNDAKGTVYCITTLFFYKTLFKLCISAGISDIV